PLQEILDEFGPLKDGMAVAASQADGYRGKLPDAMVDFWIEHDQLELRMPDADFAERITHEGQA
ncbi:GAD-like domain-containing protein, partial [Rhizobium johnstonii]|uniref:GAD-like domain-containing protein n=1 Tax=Rhizobium johnstonii TaxID=3019933 RepID=UPI003F95F67C